MGVSFSGGFSSTNSFIYKYLGNKYYGIAFDHISTINTSIVSIDYGLINGSMKLVAGDSTGKIWTSVDGISWTSYNTPFAISSAVALDNNGGIVVSANTTTQVSYSNNLTTWSTNTIAGRPRTIMYMNSIWVVGDILGNIYTSNNGASWTLRHTTTGRFYASIYAKNNYIVTGDALSTSTDGFTWTTREPIMGSDIVFECAANDSTIVAVGQNGQIKYSQDGLVWNTALSGISSHIYTVVWDNKFYVYGDGVALSSKDATTWETTQLGTGLAQRSVVTPMGIYMIDLTSGRVYFSSKI